SFVPKSRVEPATIGHCLSETLQVLPLIDVQSTAALETGWQAAMTRDVGIPMANARRGSRKRIAAPFEQRGCRQTLGRDDPTTVMTGLPVAVVGSGQRHRRGNRARLPEARTMVRAKSRLSVSTREPVAHLIGLVCGVAREPAERVAQGWIGDLLADRL